MRTSRTDLDDEGVSGGEMNVYSIGLNWHWSGNTRFMLDWAHAELDDSDGDADLFLLRYQIDF